MAYSPANFIHGTALKFHYRFFPISVSQRGSAINFYAKGRDYSSSFPVKLLPEKLPKNEGKEGAALPVKHWEKSHTSRELKLFRGFSKISSRSILFVNYKNRNTCCYSNISYELDSDAEEESGNNFSSVNLEHEQTVENSSKSCSEIQSDHSRRDAEKLAVELLASRSFTALELKKKLEGKRFPQVIVDAVITDFQNRGLINDSLYAETYSRSRWSYSSWGPRRIKQALSKKGINETDADKAIKLVFEDEDCTSQESRISLSDISMDQLYVQVSKQWERSRGVPQETRKSRIIRWLQYRGFDWSVITYLLKKLESNRHS